MEEEEEEDGMASTTDSLSSRPHTPKHEQTDYSETGI